MKYKVTYELLHEFLFYDEEDGTLYWKVRDRKWFRNQSQLVADQWNNKFAGAEAGSIWKHNKMGLTAYRVVKIFGKAYKAHRIIYWMYYGKELPESIFIDHEDHDGLNNKIKNLREATPLMSARNLPKRKSTKTKYTGVFYKFGWWKVRFQKKIIGNFATEELAYAVIEKLRRIEDFHTNHGKGFSCS